IQHIKVDGEYKYEGPYITTELSYLLRPDKFILEKRVQYVVIVRYKTPTGTESFLDEISLTNQLKGNQAKARSLNIPVSKFEDGTKNFGFPGQSGNFHFNNRIISIAIINLNFYR